MPVRGGDDQSGGVIGMKVQDLVGSPAALFRVGLFELIEGDVRAHADRQEQQEEGGLPLHYCLRSHHMTAPPAKAHAGKTAMLNQKRYVICEAARLSLIDSKGFGPIPISCSWAASQCIAARTKSRLPALASCAFVAKSESPMTTNLASGAGARSTATAMDTGPFRSAPSLNVKVVSWVEDSPHPWFDVKASGVTVRSVGGAEAGRTERARGKSVINVSMCSTTGCWVYVVTNRFAAETNGNCLAGSTTISCPSSMPQREHSPSNPLSVRGSRRAKTRPPRSR